MSAASGRPRRKSRHERRLELLQDVALFVHDAVESFEHEDRIGPDLAYLLCAMLSSSCCEWSEDRPLVQLLKERYEHDHPVWEFVYVTPAETGEEGC